MIEEERKEAYEAVPVEWIVLWLLFALSAFVSPTKAQPSTPGSARAAADVSVGSRARDGHVIQLIER